MGGGCEWGVGYLLAHLSRTSALLPRVFCLEQWEQTRTAGLYHTHLVSLPTAAQDGGGRLVPEALKCLFRVSPHPPGFQPRAAQAWQPVPQVP